MTLYLRLLFVLYLVVSVQCFPWHESLSRTESARQKCQIQEFDANDNDSDDPGEPLFLTPYVESGNITEGRKLARVTLTDNLANITSYAGFFTVNKTYNSNHYFWYIPPINNEMSAPVVLWLQGGPGGSSLFGLFEENGPFAASNKTIIYRQYNWALKQHLIYIDNPVGAGFSFTEDDKGYCNNEVEVGNDLYSTVVQFLQLFPELQQNDFFITGESYAGKYIPALAYTIHKRNPQASVKVNLKAMAIGNGYTDPIHQLQYSDYLYQLGLIDWNTANKTKRLENRTIEFIKNMQWEEAFKARRDQITYMLQVMGGVCIYNYVFCRHNGLPDGYVPIIKMNSTRKRIHVGNLIFNDVGEVAANHLRADMMQSVTPWVSELIDHYKLFIYNGQLDIIVAYPLTINYLRHLNFSSSEEYKTAERHIWKEHNLIAGYVKQAGNLTEIMVRNAGHLVPRDQPEWASSMIYKITHGIPLYN